MAVILLVRSAEYLYGSNLTAVYFALALAVLCVNPVVALFHRRFEPCELINVFLLFYALSYVLRPVAILLDPDLAEFGEHWHESDLNVGLFYVSLALAAFCLGYNAFSGQRLSMMRSLMQPRFGRRRATMAFFGMIAASIAAYTVHAQMLGGFETFFEDLIYERSFMFLGFGWLVPFENLALVAIPVGYAYLFADRVRRLAFSCGALVLIAVLVVPLSRGVFLTWLFVLVAYRHYQQRRLTASVTGAFAIVAGVAIIVLQVAREWAFGFVQEKSALEMLLYSYSTTFNGFDIAMAILSHYPDSTPFFYGKTFGDAVLYPWVPRALWSAKPLVYGGTAITEPIGSFVSGGTHVTADIIGEGYANFGLVGVVLMMFAQGIAGKAVYAHLIRRSDRSRGYTLIYAYGLALIPGWLRLGFGSIVYVGLTFFGPVALLLMWVHHRRGVLGTKESQSSGVLQRGIAVPGPRARSA